MTKIWDTSAPVFDYPDNIKKIYEDIYINQRKTFTSWVGVISSKFRDDLDWWISAAPSRNPYNSKLFHTICILESLKILKKKRQLPDKIIVNSPSLRKIVNFYFKEKNMTVKNKVSFYSSFKFFYYIFWPIIYSTSILILSKIFKNKIRKINIKNNILIDTFQTSGDLNRDRYYNKLGNKNIKNNIFFVPTILYINIFKLPFLIKKIRKNKNFILKEDFIFFSDIIYALKYIFRKRKFYINYDNYKNWDLSNIIKDEFALNQNFQAILIAILNYSFAKNLKKRNVKLKKVIDYFENTIVDKGWNFGFRKFYPKIETFGYQGHTLYRQFMCLHPSKAEYLHKVVPNKIIVIGKAYKASRKEFCKNLKVLVGPALRFDHIFSFKYQPKRTYDILITLSLDILASKKILNDVMKTSWSQSGNKIFVKPHPVMPLSKVIPKNEMPDNFEEINGNFYKISKNSKILISAGISSSIIESYVCGCAIIIPKVDKNDFYNFRYLKIPKQSYKICENIMDLDRAIYHFMKENEVERKKRIKKTILITPKLFEKTTFKNLNLFT